MSAPVRRLAAGEFIGRLDGQLAFPYASICFLGNAAEVEPHEHGDTHFVFVVAGGYATSARGADGPVSAGAAIYNPPGTRHRDAFVSPGLLMTLSPNAALEGAATDMRPAHVMNAHAAQRLREIAREARDPDALSGFVIEGACLEALATAKKKESVHAPPWLMRAKARLRATCENEISIGALAADAGVHPVYFARAFRRHVGASPGVYQRRCRATRAGDLLAHSRSPLSEIAIACGFSDPAAFTKAFTKAAGLSPGAFRRRWRA